MTQGSFQSGRKGYKPEKYDGTTDWTDYLRHFEIVDALVRHMRQRFKPEGQEEAYKAEFRSRVKRKDESFLEYGYTLRRLVIRAFPRLTYEGREELVRDQFILGLSDAEMRKHVSLSHPDSLDKAITAATEFEVVCQSTRGQFPSKPKVVSSVQEQSSSLGSEQLLCQVLEAIKNLSENQGRRRRVPRNIKCYECQELGHIRRDCPNLQEEEQNPLNSRR